MPYRYHKLIEFDPSDDPETAHLGWTLFEDRDTKSLILRNDEDPRYTLRLTRNSAGKLSKKLQEWTNG